MEILAVVTSLFFQSWFSLLVGIQLFFIRRARLICGGQVVEDIDDFNRLSLMLTGLLPEDGQHDIAFEGFGILVSLKMKDQPKLLTNEKVTDKTIMICQVV